MLFSAWPYILRVALATYFISNHLPAILDGLKNVAIGKGTLFACVSDFVPTIVAYNAWHGGFLLLASFIIFWPRPIVFLSVSLVILMIELYMDFAIANYAAGSVLTLITIIINIALLIIYARHRSY